MNILHIDASPRQESHSRQLSAAIVERLLALAPDATHAYNDELRVRLGLPPPEPLIPFHALAPVPTLTLRF